MTDSEFEEKVKKLAQTLRATGVAGSDTSARQMAEDIIRTEMRQLKTYDEKKHSPDVNPQQRSQQPVKSGSETVNFIQNLGSLRTDDKVAEQFSKRFGVDPNTPISKLTEETTQEAPVPSPAAAPLQHPAPERAQIQEPVTDAPVDEVAPPVEESIEIRDTEVEHETSAPAPNQAVDQEPPMEKAPEGMEQADMTPQERAAVKQPVQNPTQPQMQQPAPQAQPEQPAQQAPKQEEPEDKPNKITPVDLAKHFNFGKK